MPSATDDKAIYFRFGTELIDNWEDPFNKVLRGAQKTQEELDRRRFRMPKPDTDEWDKAFRQGAKDMARLDDERDRAEERGARERARREAKHTLDVQRELEARRSYEAAFVRDSQMLTNSLGQAWRKHQEDMARDAEKSSAATSKAWLTSTAALGTAMERVTYASFDLARGLAYIGAASEKDAEDLVKLIVKIEGMIAVTRSATTVIIVARDAWNAYRAARAAAAAADAAGAVATAGAAARAAGGAAGAARMGGGLATGAASAAGGLAGGGLAAGAGALLASGPIGWGVGGFLVAATATTAALWGLDSAFRNGTKSIIGSLTDADKSTLRKIDQRERMEEERGRQYSPERAAFARERNAVQEQLLRDRAAVDVYRDKSIPSADKSVVAASRGTDLAVAAARERYNTARGEAATLESRIQGNPADVMWSERVGVAERLKAAEDQLIALERQRLDVTRQTQEHAVQGMNTQLELSRKILDDQKHAADEAQRQFELESNKYRTDLERFGQASEEDQIKILSVRRKIDAGEWLNRDESRIAAGYDSFREAALEQDRRRALASGGGQLFSDQFARATRAGIAADQAREAVATSQQNVARLENEITVRVEADEAQLAQQMVDRIMPLVKQSEKTLEELLNARISQQEAQQRNLRVKADIQGR